MNLHTPGPWKVEGRGIVAPSPRGEGSQRFIVLQVVETAVYVNEPNHMKHDLQLIAAAPKLYRALQDLLGIDALDTEELDEETLTRRNRAMAAIDAADGRMS